MHVPNLSCAEESKSMHTRRQATAPHNAPRDGRQPFRGASATKRKRLHMPSTMWCLQYLDPSTACLRIQASGTPRQHGGMWADCLFGGVAGGRPVPWCWPIPTRPLRPCCAASCAHPGSQADAEDQEPGQLDVSGGLQQIRLPQHSSSMAWRRRTLGLIQALRARPLFWAAVAVAAPAVSQLAPGCHKGGGAAAELQQH